MPNHIVQVGARQLCIALQEIMLIFPWDWISHNVWNEVAAAIDCWEQNKRKKRHVRFTRPLLKHATAGTHVVVFENGC